MQKTLEKFVIDQGRDASTWAELAAQLRPADSRDHADAASRLARLTDLLIEHPRLCDALRSAIERACLERKMVPLYVTTGLLPSTGFFSETARRLSHRVLPGVIDPAYMQYLFARMFPHVSDAEWVAGIADSAWLRLLEVLFGEGHDVVTSSDLPPQIEELAEALRILSYHVSAIGLEPELVRIDPTLEEHESPFMAQNAELVGYLALYKQWWHKPETTLVDEKHLLVMLEQCRDVVIRIRRKAAKLGTSLTLNFKLERLREHLVRMGQLLELLTTLRKERRLGAVAPQVVSLFKEAVQAECRKNVLSDYWGKNLALLTLRMTENSSKTGEHFIASNAGDYFGILRSAMLGGIIIAMMAGMKIVYGSLGLAPGTLAVAFCLNYGLGFVLIHVLGGTVATKQPAMTANAIAATIGEAQDQSHARNLDDLVETIVRTIRSQVAAIVGNVGVAIPFAMLLAWAIHASTGAHFLSPEYAQKMLTDVDPLGGTVFYAAIAGVCLFLSGLIAGYYDNACAFGRVPQRIENLRWLRRLAGEKRTARIAIYIENNLGALVANFIFGCMLGGFTALGMLFGLPLDIRHIAFSSGYVGYAAVGLEFAIPLSLVLWSALGVALIGLTNLAVSFSLTLSVALRARKLSIAQGGHLLGMLFRRFLRNPFDFILPPFLQRAAQRTMHPPPRKP